MEHLRGARVVLRPVVPTDAPELRAMHAEPEIAAWWGPPEEGFPFEDDDVERWVVEVDEEIVGMVQCYEEPDPMYRHASVDLFIAPRARGKGVGPEALRLVRRHLADERGHHRIQIDPAAENTAAVRAYEKAGSRTVGTMRRAERDPQTGAWRDLLLMEWVADEPPATR